MASHQQIKARSRWRRNRRIRALKIAADKTFEDCGPTTVGYGVPFPENAQELSEEDLVRLEQTLTAYL